MQRVFTLVFLIFISNTAFAGYLCDAACNLTITFPDGGSIEAVEPLTITFGEGGYVNDGAVTTGYAAGETLVFAAGESLLFTAGGMLDIGVDGNIEYTNMTISTNGVIEIAVNGGAEQVSIFDMTLSGSIELVFNGTLVVVESGTLTTKDGNMTLTGADGASFVLHGTWNVQSDSSGPAGTCGETGSGLTVIGGLSSGIVTALCPVSIEFIGGGSITVDPSLTVDIATVAIGIYNIEPLTAENLAILAGQQWVTSDGKSCTVTSDGDCITSEGEKYVVVDGKLVPAADGSGQLGIYILMSLFFMLVCLRNHSIFAMRKC